MLLNDHKKIPCAPDSLQKPLFSSSHRAQLKRKASDAFGSTEWWACQPPLRDASGADALVGLQLAVGKLDDVIATSGNTRAR